MKCAIGLRAPGWAHGVSSKCADESIPDDQGKEKNERKSFRKQTLQAPWVTKNTPSGEPGDRLLSTLTLKWTNVCVSITRHMAETQ